MRLRIQSAFALALLAASPLLAQPAPLSLCIVQTKASPAIEYEPSAGPWAIALYKHLSDRKLDNGSALHITVLAASMEKEVAPEVHRLQCAWVVQLWHHRSADNVNFGRNASSQIGSTSLPVAGPTPVANPEMATPNPVADEDSLYFTLWNAATAKVIARGAGVLPRRWQDPLTPDPLYQPGPHPLPYATFARQILKHLNKLP